MDIELTSRRPDDAWTWRAAGARQPRGVVAAPLVPDGSKPGDILRAEVESGIEGIEILSVLPSRAPAREESGNRIEVIGPGRTGPDVSVVLASGSKRRRESGSPDRGGRPSTRRIERGQRGVDPGVQVGGPGWTSPEIAGRIARDAPRDSRTRPAPAPGRTIAVDRVGAPPGSPRTGVLAGARSGIAGLPCR